MQPSWLPPGPPRLHGAEEMIVMTEPAFEGGRVELGLRADGETFRCQRTLDFAPAHQKRLGQINALRATYPVLMETYRDTDGLANSNPGAILARVFTDGKRLAAVACTAKGKAASGEIKVTGWTPVSSEGIDDARITFAGDAVKLDLPADALAVIEFSP